MGVWAVVVRETAWGMAGILNMKGVEKLSGSSRSYCNPDIATQPCHMGSGKRGCRETKSHLAAGVCSISTLCVCVCVCVCVLDAQFFLTLWTPWTLDDAKARNRTVLGMGATKTVSRKHNLCGNFIRIKKYMLVKLFICIPLVVFLSCFVESFVFRRTSASKSLLENSVWFYPFCSR